MTTVACTKDNDVVVPIDPDYTVTYSGTFVGHESVNGTLPFCSAGEQAQRVNATQTAGLPQYSTTIGNTFPLMKEVDYLATRLIGQQEVRDTLTDESSSPYATLSRLLDGAQDIEAYFDAEFVVDGKRYRTIYSAEAPTTIDWLDAAARVTISYELLTTGSCRGGDYGVIRTEVHYDGYVYNVLEPTDSLRLTDFAATLYNYGF